MSSRDDRLRLVDILQSLDHIEQHVGGRTKEAFVTDNVAIDGVAYRLVVVGEAVANLPSELLAKESAVPWSEIRALRNRLVHAYFGIDLDIMWGIIANDLAPLRSAVARLLKGLP
jgi:uncharacterized protein with HEPN domain